jgi:hypothetical protein
LISEDHGFNPSGELARLHIRSAVLHLLQHQPVQGKYALERLLREVRSEYFPVIPATAVQALSSGPLKRPRDSLVRNFVIVLLKDVLSTTLEWRARARAFVALHAVKKLHPRVYELTLQDRLPSLFRALPDDALHLGIKILTQFNDYWQVLPHDMQLKIEAYTAALPAEHFEDVESILGFAPLRKYAEYRVRKASRTDIRNSGGVELPVITDRYIDLYLASDSRAQANDWAEEMRMLADIFTAAQQSRILAGIHNNDQLLYANTVSSVIAALRNSKKLAPTEFERVLEANGLQKFMLDC